MKWRGTLRVVYACLLVLVGLLFLAVMLSQIEMTKRAAKAPVLAFSIMSLLWLSPGILALLSAWRLWAVKGVALAFWVIVSPAYALAGYLAHDRPEIFAWLVGCSWGLGFEAAFRGGNVGGGSMASAAIWLALLVIGMGGLFGIATILFPKDILTDPGGGTSAEMPQKRR